MEAGQMEQVWSLEGDRQFVALILRWQRHLKSVALSLNKDEVSSLLTLV
jgi:hypothetical protein